MRPNVQFAIVGGGLAGLATAQALAAVGIDADVFESAAELGEIGAAVNTSSQANKALQAIGLGEKIASVGDPSPSTYTCHMQTGEVIEFNDVAIEAARYGPFYTFHRADLWDVLATGLNPDAIHLGHRLAGLTEGDGPVTLTFANGATVKADYVIGADGVKSIVRQGLYGDDNPTYTGQLVWRVLLNGNNVPPDILEPTGRVQWVMPGRHFIAYYIRGKKLVNIVTQQDTDEWIAESWSTHGDPDEMRASFPNPEPRLKMLLSLVTDCLKWGLFTRPLTTNWGRGRIQLIGDAAHAMLPSAGQGACQAFEDAYILARWLEAERANPIEAFRNFRRVRIPRVHAIQQLSTNNARFKHMADMAAQKTLIASGKGSVNGRMDWVYDFDPVTGWDKEPTVPAIELAQT